MEYIEGERIHSYARENGLCIPDKLLLFQQVCAAVSYAHQHLVVHRDLKPSNILVTATGVPKLLDFGIAKVISPDGLPGLTTVTAGPIMTPEYASPEQIEGAAATTLSDVYSLGAVLYELLSGHPPHRLKTRTRQEVEQTVHTEIEKPSTVVSRPEDKRQLRGDLDNIALMAMRKETSRRYQSVEQFSEDIQRHLTGLPVIARRDTLPYRAVKFVRRNRIGVTAALLLVVTLIAGVVATAWQARRATIQEHRARDEQARAERRFNDVRKLANNVLFEYYDAIKSLPGSTKVRERLVKDALTYLDSLSAEAHGDIALQRELAAAYERVGDVRAGLRAASLGDTAGAADSYRKALGIRQALLALQPGDAQARRDLANAHSDLGTCLRPTEPKTGAEHLQKARALLLELTREQPANEELVYDLAMTATSLARALSNAGDLKGAMEQYHAAASIPERLIQKKPGEPKFILLQITAEQNLATAFWEEQGDDAAAQASIDKALALFQVLIAQDPLNTSYQLGLAYFYSYAGRIREEGDPPAALDYFRKAVEVREKLMKADPANSAAETGVADSYFGMARTLSHQGDVAQALSSYVKAAEHFEKQSGAVTNPNWKVRLKAVTAGAGAAEMQARSGKTDVALQQCSGLTARLSEIPDDPANVETRSFRGEAYEYLGYAYRDIAAALKTSVNQGKKYTTAARDMFRQSKNISDDARTRGGLTLPDARQAKSVAEEMAKCDKALEQ
jgi:non-specific serine/threonine protein kinase/serine/threonine-protein kinase